MIGEKRTTVEILHEILKLAQNGEKKTRIMYGANLSYDMLTKYLDFLQTKGFLVHDAANGRFVLTERGSDFLADITRVTRHLHTDSEAAAQQVAATPSASSP